MSWISYFLLPLLVSGSLDSSKLSWSTGKDMWPATSDLTSTLAPDGNIYLAGGCMSSNGNKFDPLKGVFRCDAVTNKFFRYLPSANTYQTALPNMDKRRYRHAAAVANNHLYILGGRMVSDELVLQIEAFDFDSETWKVVGEFTEEQAASDLGAFSSGNTIYIVGGYDKNYNAKKSVWRIDASNPDSVTVSEATPLHEARGDVRAHQSGNHAWVVGGYTHENNYCPALSSVERFDLATEKWVQVNQPLQNARANMALTTLGDHLVTVGGESPAASDCNVFFPEPGANTAILDSMEALDDSDNTAWELSTSSMMTKRFRFGDAVTVDNKAYFFGGLDDYDSTCKCFSTTAQVLILTYDNIEPTAPPVNEPTAPPVDPTAPPVDPTAPPVEPTSPPVEEPTAPPMEPTSDILDDEEEEEENPPMAFCFASEAMVEVSDHRGHISMKDLRIGDYVKVASGDFSQVYSFGHYEPNVKGEYLSIKVRSNSNIKPLLISSHHMVLLENQEYVPASRVTVGDSLTLANGDHVAVKSIKSVMRKGAFAPFTKDGSIIVNGLVVSSFVALEQDASSSFMIGGFKTLSLHTLAYVFEAPHRIMCSINFDYFCQEETYSKEGLSAWIEGPLAASQWLVQQAAWIKLTVALPALVVFMAVAMMEQLMLHTSPVLLLLLGSIVAGSMALHKRREIKSRRKA